MKSHYSSKHPNIISIPCGSDESAYEVLLRGENLRSLFEANARKNFGLRHKKGEKLVEAIVAAGGVTDIDRRNKNNEPADGPHGEEAVRMYAEISGRLLCIEHYKDGKLH